MYQITLNEQQVELIIKALDIYSRVGLGQVSTIIEHPDCQKRILKIESLDFWSVRDGLNIFKKQVFGLHENQSYGIHSKEIDESNRTAYDMIQVLRHRVSWDKAGNPEKRDWTTMLGVNYDEPMKTSDQPLVSIQKVDN